MSEEAMGQYAAVILNGDGFVQEHGKAGLQAAFTGQKLRFSKISSVERLREMIRDYDDSLPPEDELVRSILKNIETIRRESERSKKAPKRRRARANA